MEVKKKSQDLPQVTHIVAYDQKTRAIGYKNNLLYKLDKDLQHFRNVTMNNIIVMGRKTHESIGRLLPQRINVILSRQTNLFTQKYNVFSDIETALKWCQTIFPDKTIFIIGGAEIYKATLPYTSTIIATEIESKSNVEADTFYPDLPDEFILEKDEKVELDIDQFTQSVKTFKIQTFHRL